VYFVCSCFQYHHASWQSLWQHNLVVKLVFKFQMLPSI
jgi:hypothetical protein